MFWDWGLRLFGAELYRDFLIKKVYPGRSERHINSSKINL